MIFFWFFRQPRDKVLFLAWKKMTVAPTEVLIPSPAGLDDGWPIRCTDAAKTLQNIKMTKWQMTNDKTTSGENPQIADKH